MSGKKLKIAITGSIGSGKSAFADFIKEAGYTIIKADDISKEILARNNEVKEKVINAFGKESFTDSEINRKYLAEKVFSDPGNVMIINSILHPLVIKKVNDLMLEELKKSDRIFVEAALIYEADMEEMFDYVVLITAGKEVRYNRKSGTLTPEDFEKRDFNQIPDEEKKKRADFIFENNGSLKELRDKAKLLLSLI
ncbi:MAG TPA: dephospho-CoA kinase [Ignavibacteriaceae bacterium]|nr:dephospho-CoA kinase [Ignavibacteriaceae bacterium]